MATPLDLGLLNKGSAKVASFLVRATQGKADMYTYTDKRTSKTVTVHQYLTKLVGENPSSYCTAFIKGTPAQIKAAKEKFADGSVWTLSKVVFDPQDKAAYISSPLPFRVDLAKSTLRPHATDSDADEALREKMPLCVVPPRTVAEIACIKTTRSTDLLAIVKQIKKDRVSSGGMAIADVTLIDDTKTPKGKLATVVVSVFGEDKLTLLKTKVGEPMVFFNVTAKYNAGLELTHYESEIVTTAPLCPKTTSLLGNKVELQSASNTEQLTTDWAPQNVAKDVSGDQPLSCTAFLDFTSEQPNANMPEIVQVPWLHVEEPQPGDGILDQSGSRVWYHIAGRDASGSAVLGMPQKNAFKLSHATTLADFQEKHGQGVLNMPLFCHARISRTLRGGGPNPSSTGATKGQDSLQQAFVNTTIEEIEPVSWDSKAYPTRLATSF